MLILYATPVVAEINMGGEMHQYVEQIIWQIDDAPAKLKSMDLERDKLIRAAAVAIGQANNVTRNFASNAWGTFAHHHGLAELRNQFVGPKWKIDRSEGIESIINDVKMLKVTFQNVDVAMGVNDPKPRSPKGAGAERACEGNLAPLFPDAPIYVPVVSDIYELWSLMVDETGNLELSRPVVQDKTFSICRERILIATADDWMGSDPAPSSGTDDVADDFDVNVSLKRKI
ncbi:hypothetical protein WSK_3785 [Novosphingobium sp. Rr 2-17]|uniref:hypothetical protein n=1 Tax=Novosphingobium sp. Rr 2-17 TaxID=555793 RepID=UPI00026985A2|nr:hypothetical protein [Novosphingobium sp. Rr 2-17]EIZ77774.1 hypothetical protein WSK_3785 [Novosphingobium sp. Rr 2-17]